MKYVSLALLLPVAGKRIAYSSMFLCVVAFLFAMYREQHKYNYDAPATNFDAAQLDELILDLAARSTIGTIDNGLSFTQLNSLSLVRPVEMTCTPLSEWAVTVLRGAGFRARLAQFLTLEEWSDNNGHTVIEAWHPGYNGWVVVDLTYRRMYPQTALSWIVKRGDYLSLGEMDFDPERPDTYPHVDDVVMIKGNDGYWYFGDTANAERVMSYHSAIRYVPDFVVRFYGILPVVTVQR